MAWGRSSADTPYDRRGKNACRSVVTLRVSPPVLCLAPCLALGLALGACGRRELPQGFAADASDEVLLGGYKLEQVWSVPHPEYDEPVRVLLQARPVRNMSPDHAVAFYERGGDAYTIIDKPLVFGGYEDPALGVLPDGTTPAVVAKMEAIDELATAERADVPARVPPGARHHKLV